MKALSTNNDLSATVCAYILAALRKEDELSPESTEKECIQYVCSEFKRVAGYPDNIKRIPNLQKRFIDYLGGVPFHFAFDTYAIEKVLQSWGLGESDYHNEPDEYFSCLIFQALRYMVGLHGLSLV